MSQLIYHPIGEADNNVSRLDETIMEMVSSKAIKIACPYIGREPLERVFSQCTTWQLLTDLSELLPSMGLTDRTWFMELLTEYQNHIRHIKGIHAKVLLAGQRGLVGSANLTMKGLTKRIEMGVLFMDEQTVGELNCWFDDLWDRCSPVELETVVNFLKRLPNRSLTEDYSASLSLPLGPQVNFSLKEMQRKDVQKSGANAVTRQKGIATKQSIPSTPMTSTYNIVVPTATIGVDGEVRRGKDKVVQMPFKEVLILALLQENAGKAFIKEGAGGLKEMLEDVYPSGENNVQKDVNKFCRYLAKDGLSTFGTKKYPIQEMPIPHEERKQLLDLLAQPPRRGEKRTITSLGQLVEVPAVIRDLVRKKR